ncbi:MAG: DUF1804 family protein [Magnetococcales bacterium]|nr:DUF1804 family protein [Magnetococcales bacterium]
MIKKTPATTVDSKDRPLKGSKSKTSQKGSGASVWLSKEKRQELLDKLLGEFLLLHKEAMESVKTEITDPIKRVEALTRLSQALDRTLTALIKASPQTSNLTIAQDVLKHEVAFVENNFPEHAAALLTILEPFGAELINIYDE